LIEKPAGREPAGDIRAFAGSAPAVKICKRVFNPDRKGTHWGKLKLARDK
jgi:hypothetical protein